MSPQKRMEQQHCTRKFLAWRRKDLKEITSLDFMITTLQMLKPMSSLYHGSSIL